MPASTKGEAHQPSIDTNSLDSFLAMLPTIRRRAEQAFRTRDAEARDDAVAEIVAAAFLGYARLAARGKVDVAYPTVLFRYALRHFYGGRRVASRFNTEDVLSVAAQRRRGFVVERFDRQQNHESRKLEAVAGRKSSSTADQAAFRCDFPEWLERQTRRNQRLAVALALGHSTAVVARCFAISSGRVSQLRRELRTSWLAFQSERHHPR